MLNHKMPLIALLTLFLLFQSSSAISDEVQPVGEINEAAVEVLASAPNLVTNISLSPDTPNILAFGNDFTVSFNYVTNQAGGVRIFARPMTGSILTPHYAACPSPLYPTPSGAGTCDITITSGNVTVDKIRFQILNADQSKLLFQTTIPVHYKFR